MVNEHGEFVLKNGLSLFIPYNTIISYEYGYSIYAPPSKKMVRYIISSNGATANEINDVLLEELDAFLQYIRERLVNIWDKDNG